MTKGIKITVAIEKDNQSFLKFYGDYISEWLAEEAEKWDCVLRSEDELKLAAFKLMAQTLLEDGVDEDGFEGKFTDTDVRERVFDLMNQNLELFCVVPELDQPKPKGFSVDQTRKDFLRMRVAELKNNSPCLENSHISDIALMDWERIRKQLKK